ncbi:hypothetical protein [Chryseobacterium sp. MIQD13]|uniref:hypothetical protein n=1 Tax=Chryseobacterium sp. MIQD13 TaxID=3422310 RepID=UPI003D2E93C7
MIEYIHQYYSDEKQGAVYALIASVVLLISGIFIWLKFSDNQMSKGIAVGFLVISMLLLGGAISTISYNNRKLAAVENLKDKSEAELQRDEVQRMDKVMNVTFRYAFISFAVLMGVAVLMIIILPNEFWKGISISLMILVCLLIISDSFSKQRNQIYFDMISKSIFKD